MRCIRARLHLAKPAEMMTMRGSAAAESVLATFILSIVIAFSLIACGRSREPPEAGSNPISTIAKSRPNA